MEELKPNWGMIGVFVIGILFWANVWFNGLFISVMELIIISAVVGLWLRLSGRA